MDREPRLSEARSTVTVTEAGRGAIEARLASATGHSDEAPNILLAEELCQTNDSAGVAHVADILRTGNRAAQSDAIKVLYEVGARDPRLLLAHTDLFLEQMGSNNNRIVWGALTALAAVCKADAQTIRVHLDAILAAADAGSVIAKDQAVQILITLKSDPAAAEAATAHLFDRLRHAAINQLLMYAERIGAVVGPTERERFRAILTGRLSDEMPASKRKRLEKVIARLAH